MHELCYNYLLINKQELFYMFKKILFSFMAFFIFAAPTFAQEVIQLNQSISEKDIANPKKKTISNKYLTSTEAHQLKESNGKNVLFLDIRTRAEIAYVGSPKNVDGYISYMEHEPYMQWSKEQKRFAMDTNSDFGKGVEYHLEKNGLSKENATIVLLCRSGERSAKAADLLNKLNFKNVYSVVDGFEGDMSKEGQRTVNGWKNNNLPWTYNVDVTGLIMLM